ncbi:TonB family protein [Oleomonas cavernae]|uniref:TonB family protein n=1 Tax=Oleomonas cavernae TaxID=2320859 RepID=A0A418WFU3_9PROT|nr:TonB family protein [Oleomonas cavernae]RJF88886.1 TonB family protein [Oleomonas cavernae]
MQRFVPAALAVVMALGSAPVSAATGSSDFNKKTDAPAKYKVPAPGAEANADLDAWQDQVAEIVDATLTFPLAGRLSRQGGTTGIRLVIDRSGKVDSATVEKPSGNEDIDDVTKRFFENLALPPLPASYGHEKLSFLYTIRYDFRD